MNNQEFWKIKIANFFHDPPDKTIKISGHESRRNEIFKEIFGENLEPFLKKAADQISSTMQRFFIPKDKTLTQGSLIDWNSKIRPEIKHPLTGDIIEESLIYEEFMIDHLFLSQLRGKQLDNLKKKLKNFGDDWKKKFIYIWDRIFDLYPKSEIYPADTRFPDHSIIDHNDITSSIAGCLEKSENFGLFAFKLPGVQKIISSSRKFSDLWASSHLMSLLTFISLAPLIENFGPDMIIFPYLRRDPLLDKFLNYSIFEGQQILEIEKDIEFMTIPNIFLSILPSDQEILDKIIEKIKQNFEIFLNLLIDCLYEILKQNKVKLNENFLIHAKNYINNYFSPTTAFIKFPKNLEEFKDIEHEIPPDIKDFIIKVRDLEENGKLHYHTNTGLFYNLIYILSQVLIAQKSRLFKNIEIKGNKCNVCGEQSVILDYKNLEQSQELIKKGFISENENFCILCLIKRFYKRIISDKSLEEEFPWIRIKEPPKIESLFEIANPNLDNIIKELKNIDLNISEIIDKIINQDIELLDITTWEGTSIQERLEEIGVPQEIIEEILDEQNKKYKFFREKLGSLNKYYALLKIDGDNIGKFLSGENLPQINKILHSKYYQEIKEFIKDNFLIGNNIYIRRPLTPSYHLSLSKAMKFFALYKAPDIIKKCNGKLIYSGGDDIFAILPVKTALEAASQINETFSKKFYITEDRYIFGLSGCTISGGIVFAHYKYPLSETIEQLNSAEKKAKEKFNRTGAFILKYIDHGGRVSIGGTKWCIENDLLEFVSKFIRKDKVKAYFSRQFFYRLSETLNIFPEATYYNQVKLLLTRHFVIQENLNKIEREKLKKKEIEETFDFFKNIYNKYKELNEIFYKDNRSEFIQNFINLFLILYKVLSTREEHKE